MRELGETKRGTGAQLCGPDLKSCSAFGENTEEAFRDVGLSKAAWLQNLSCTEKAYPPARCWPAIYAAPALSQALFHSPRCREGSAESVVRVPTAKRAEGTRNQVLKFTDCEPLY